MPSSFHRQRLALQGTDDVDYLIAWQGEDAVGHVLLRWLGPEPASLRDRVEPVPYLEALAVKEELRWRGIGTRLLAAAEAMVRGRGLRKIGLSVGVENWAALALYARRGYKLSDLDAFDVSWSYVDHDGALNVEEERCFYLTKELVE
jgi:ribosomal protein S18 acetylase RimI-like enzyme